MLGLGLRVRVNLKGATAAPQRVSCWQSSGLCSLPKGRTGSGVRALGTTGALGAKGVARIRGKVGGPYVPARV